MCNFKRKIYTALLCSFEIGETNGRGLSLRLTKYRSQRTRSMIFEDILFIATVTHIYRLQW